MIGLTHTDTLGEELRLSLIMNYKICGKNDWENVLETEYP